MYVARSISADHKDLIHDVAFDFYGRRMATCSSDHSVQVWDINDKGEWHCTASWKTHSGSVWRVTWAHPEFGQVLASCSYDRMAAIWEEVAGSTTPCQKRQGHWTKRATLVDSRTSVTDVKFSPRFLGLKLATCSADGNVRIYEAPDLTDLTTWEIQDQIMTKMSCSCLSWNPSRLNPATIAVGSDDANPSAGGKVQIYEHKVNERKWVRSNMLMSITEAVHDIAYAPNLGRSYDVLAIATKDVVIMRFDKKDPSMIGSATSTRNTPVQLDHQGAQVWQISWNITGTILAASSDDGVVRLWKANYLDKWKCIQVLKGDGSSVSTMLVQPKDPPATNKGSSLPETSVDAGFMSSSPKFSSFFSSTSAWLGSSPLSRQGRHNSVPVTPATSHVTSGFHIPLK